MECIDTARLNLLLIAKKKELEKELEESDFSQIDSVRQSKYNQIDAIDLLLKQL